MEELARLITVISLHMDVDRVSILQGSGRKASHARDILCHTIYECHPYLMKSLCDMVSVCKAALYNAKDRVSLRIDEDPAFRKKINNIRRDLSLPLVKEVDIKNVKKEQASNRRKLTKSHIPVPQSIFGFKWSDIENLRICRAEKDSVAFMQKYCSIGEQPIAEGMVVTRQRPTTWYRN